MRGDCVSERSDGAVGADGFAAIGAGGCGGATGGGTTESGAAACAPGGVAAGGWAARAGTVIVGGVTADAGGWETGGGAEIVGLGVGGGTMTLAAGTATEAGSPEAFTVETVGAAGDAAADGRTEGAAALTGPCCLRMAFRTSPGLEILERSILVLISSLSTRLGRECFVEVCASLAARK